METPRDVTYSCVAKFLLAINMPVLVDHLTFLRLKSALIAVPLGKERIAGSIKGVLLLNARSVKTPADMAFQSAFLLLAALLTAVSAQES